MKAPKLSVSSLKMLQSCEAKYFHYKVNNTPKDPDYEESDSLGLGKAFHQVLEKTNHNDWNESLMRQAMADHNVEPSEAPLLSVMLDKYVKYHKLSGLKVVKCELGIETSQTVLFLDAVALDERGWWIIDLKTAARHDENILPQLPRDIQMNHYASFANDVEIALPEIAGLPFLGCRYRQIVKSKAGTMKGLDNGVKVVDIEIPVEVLATEEFQSLFSHIYDRAVELHKGEAPRKNFSACFNYFSPCQYFSQCHGELFSKGKSRVRVHTLDSIQSGDLL